MRLPRPTAPTPSELEFDVVISQMVGLQANGESVRTKQTGGSEFQVVLLAEALAAAGKRVGVVSPVFAFMRQNGVDYIPNGEVLGRPGPFDERRPSVRVSTEVLISERFGALPVGVEFSRVVFDLHDLPDSRLEGVIAVMHDVPDSRVVVHSTFTESLLEGWPNVHVIPCMLPDDFYGRPSPVRANPKQKRYVYGSAALKGLEPTLALWKELKRTKRHPFKRAMLNIASPGYDDFDRKLLEGAEDIELFTGLSPAGIQVLLGASDGIFMASTYPETFGIVMAQAEVAGVPAHVLQLHRQVDALHTTLANPDTLFTEAVPFVDAFSDVLTLCPAKDYRVSTHLGSWLKVLGFKQQKEQAA